MTDPASLTEVPGIASGHLALSRLISVEHDAFAAEVWGRTALLSPAAELPRGFEDLLDAEAVDELVSRRGLRTPFLRVAKAGSTLADRAFTGPGGVGAAIADQVSDDKLVRLFAAGSTLVLQALHRVWPPLIDFCQQLAAELGHPVQANAYVTPPQNQGFSNHYDVHDVFVLQVSGEKQWTIHAPVHPAPLRDQPWTDRREAVERRAHEPALLETVLGPGDCLYLPRGFLHAAKALGGVSTHLTLGVHSWTRHALAGQLLQEALQQLETDEAIRGSLPLGVNFTDVTTVSADVEAVRTALVAAVGHVDVATVARAFVGKDRDSSRAAPIGPLRQLRDADRLTEDSRLRLRSHLAATLDSRTGAPPVLRSRAGEVPVAQTEVPGIEALLTAGQARVGDLGADLARRLVLAGVAVAE